MTVQRRFAPIGGRFESESVAGLTGIYINVAEIYYGACRTGRSDKIIRVFEESVLPCLTVLPFDTESGRRFGRLKASLEARGLPRSEPDLRIAAIALQHRLTIVTGNVRHFSGIPGLAVENWLE